MIQRKSLLLAAIMALFVTSCLSAPLASEATITLNPSITHQTWLGWEATPQVGQLACDSEDFVPFGNGKVCPAFVRYQNQMFDLAVAELGINRVRLGINPGVESDQDYYTQFLNAQISERDWTWVKGAQPVNDNDDPNVINPGGFIFTSLDHRIETSVLPLKQRLEARGEKLIINVCYSGFHEPTSGFKHWDDPNEYAEFVLAAYQHMQSKYGFVPDLWEIVLEADNTSFNGTAIGLALQATAARLQAHGFTPRFIVPSTASMSDAILYFNDIRNVIGDAGVRQYIRQLSYHRYEDVNDSALQWIGATALSYGIGGAMLEHIGSGYEDLYQDLTLGQNSSWSQFTIAKPYYWGSNDDGGAYYLVDDTDASNPQIIMGSRTKFLRQYFLFIREEAVRIGASASDEAFGPVAFINADGKNVVVVKANNGGVLTIQGLPAGTYGIKYTTANEYDVDRPDVVIRSGEPVTTNIPAAGAITIYAKASSSTPAPVTATPKPMMTSTSISGQRPRAQRVCACVEK